MRLNEVELQAAEHRAAVVALLRSYLPYGRRELAARAVGKRPEYLSRLLSDRGYSAWGKSKHRSDPRLEPLSPDLAARLADWLGLDDSSRAQLLNHAELSHESHVKECSEMEAALSGHELNVILPDLMKLHAAAGRELNPSLASNLFMRAYCMAKQVMKSLPPRDYPLEFAQVCLVLNDLEAVLDRNVDGVYHARLAQHWARVGGKKESSLLGKGTDQLWENALFAETVSTHNLGLDGEARLLSSVVFTARINIWSCEAALNRLKYTPFAQRTSLRQVDKLLDQYLEAVEKFGSRINQAPTRLSFLHAKLQAYLACYRTKASLKKAEAEFEQCLSESAPGKSEESSVFAFISQIGVLRSVIFLNTYGQLLKARGDLFRAEKIRAKAESRANRSGLVHQLAWIRAGHPFA
jgi:tetratricopeptide (TPR) repeat protein